MTWRPPLVLLCQLREARSTRGRSANIFHWPKKKLLRTHRIDNWCNWQSQKVCLTSYLKISQKTHNMFMFLFSFRRQDSPTLTKESKYSHNPLFRWHIPHSKNLWFWVICRWPHKPPKTEGSHDLWPYRSPDTSSPNSAMCLLHKKSRKPIKLQKCLEKGKLIYALCY